MYSQKISTKAKEQIAAIICSDQKEFSINIKPVQRQKGGADCGLFAIAYAQSLCNGMDPIGLNYMCRYRLL